MNRQRVSETRGAAQRCSCTCERLETGDGLAAQQNPQEAALIGGYGRRRGCLHGEDYVVTESGRRRIDDLAIHDRQAKVLSRNDNGELQFSQIAFWIHSKPNDSVDYFEVETEHGQRISLTREHLIYRTNCISERQRSITAEHLQVGDCVFVIQDEELTQTRVKVITIKNKVGIYSPVTETGSIIVNDVLASCYTTIENESIQKLLFKYAIVLNKIIRMLLPRSIYELIFVPEEGSVPPAIISAFSIRKLILS
ncbi:unnamed protein product [Soboliphyme baturini]|uniref:HintN domain-containing protein n=1 Tax=Soboliphyme baturini TaxID=241478 RepID=A0A183IEU6_9BILA|nr:unnamed protein product [Soboliphyme baturini]